MNIDSLKYFVEIANYKNISTVAKKFHITQSALSQQLAKLEQNLNTKLLDRSNKGVTLTKEGLILLKYSETIINTYSKMHEEINSFHHNKLLVCIDSIESLTSSILPSVIADIKKQQPSYIINLKTNDQCSIFNLYNNLCDIYISYNKPDDNCEVISKMLYSDKLLLVADESYPLDKIEKKNLQKLSFILSLDKYCITKSLEDAFSDSLDSIDDLDIIYSTNSYLSAINGLKSSKAITLLPNSIYKSYKETHNLKIIELSDFNLELNVYINYLTSFKSKNSNFIKLLIKSIKNYL